MCLKMDEKKRKRLERNRESAKLCRQRKKERKLNLQEQLLHLEAENLQLRLQLTVGHESTEREHKSNFITSQLDSLLKQGAGEAEIQKTIQELQERFSDYGRDRRSAIDFHVNQLKRCLQPTQTTTSILWLMSIVAKFHDVNGEFKPKMSDELSDLWYSLMKAVKPSAAQRKTMVSFSTPREGVDPFKEVHSTTEDCNNMLDRIVRLICNKNESLDSEMAKIQAILSPRQTAKFILWIDQNPACMQMLEALWPHVTKYSKVIGNSSDSDDKRDVSKPQLSDSQGEAEEDSEEEDGESESD